MTRTQTPRDVDQLDRRPLTEALSNRHQAMEKLIRAIEDELSDDELDDELRLQNIGERVAQFTDGG